MIQETCEFYLQPLHYHLPMTYGERLQESMTHRSISRKMLAEAIGVTPHAIGMVITGGGREERWLSRENNQKAAKVLKVDAHWLWTGEGNKSPAPEPDANVIATESAPGTISNHARVLGQLYDELPDDLRLRARVYAYITNLLEDVIERKTFELPVVQPHAVSRKKQLS